MDIIKLLNDNHDNKKLYQLLEKIDQKTIKIRRKNKETQKEYLNFMLFNVIFTFQKEKNITDEIIKYFERSTDPESKTCLSYCYYFGFGVKSSKIKSFKIIEDAAKTGYKEALRNYAYGLGFGLQEFLDHQKGFAILTKLVDDNYSYALCSLGHFYYFGIGTPIDKKKSYELYKKANDIGLTNGFVFLADCYSYGIVVEVSKKKANKLYKKGVDNYSGYGYNRLGLNYINGIGCEKNIEKGIKYLEKSIEYGYYNSFCDLSLSYLYGDVVEKDIDKVFRYLEKGIKKECTSSYRLMAALYLDGDVVKKDLDKGINILKGSVKLGSGGTQTMLGRVYEEEGNYCEAFKYYMMAAKNKNKEGQYKLGECFQNGKGCNRSLNKAEYWYKQSDYIFGSDNSKSKLAHIYKLQNKYVKVLEVYDKHEDNRDCQYNAGLMFFIGIGFKRDIKKSLKYFEKAFKLGSIHSAYFLAKIYYKNSDYKDIYEAHKYLTFCSKHFDKITIKKKNNVYDMLEKCEIEIEIEDAKKIVNGELEMDI